MAPIPPEAHEPEDLRGYLETLSRAAFQSGISWRVIDAKWDGIREAFGGFDPETVANFDAPDVDRLMADARVIRNKRKIDGTIDNARMLLELDAQPGGFRGYLRSFGTFDETVAALKKRFHFIGDTGAYYFLYVVGEKVPPHEEWAAAHPQINRPRR